MAFFTSDNLRSNFEATIGNLNQKLINCKRIFYKNSKQALLCHIESYQKIPPILLFSKKSPTYTFINFERNFPPILLFGTVVYSELQSRLKSSISTYGSFDFFSSAALTAQNGPKLKFHAGNVCLKTHLSADLCPTGMQLH